MKKGLNLNVRNRNDETPLLLACRKGYKDVAEHLIDNGADIWAKQVTQVAFMQQVKEDM